MNGIDSNLLQSRKEILSNIHWGFERFSSKIHHVGDGGVVVVMSEVWKALNTYLNYFVKWYMKKRYY